MPRRTTTGTTSSNEALYAFDTAKRAEHGTVCGVDEAGRGPLCGPVCCAAVILNPDDPIEGVNDSKKLTEKRRDALYEEITKRALAYKIIFISPQEIDERNILWATMDGMAQAVAGLEITRFWQRSAVTVICSSWTSSTRSTSLPGTRAIRPSCTTS